MNFTLLWIDGLLISLLWVATLVAFIGHVRRRWVRACLLPITIGVPLFFFGTLVFAAAATRFFTAIRANGLVYAVSLLATYLVGASLILRRGRSPSTGLLPASSTWARGILSFALVMSLVIGYMTLVNMDLAIRSRCAIQSVKVNSRYLAALPAVPSYSQNAATLYQKAFAQLSADPPTDVMNPPTGKNDVFDPNEPATLAYLSRRAGTIDLLRRAAALPGCRFDADLSDPELSATLADLNQSRGAANVLNLHAREALAHGQVTLALADADAIFHMSRHVGQRPMIISGLVGVGIAALGVKTLELALPAVKSTEELSALHLQELPPPGVMMQQALRGEEIFGLYRYGNLLEEPEQTALHQIGGPAMVQTGTEPFSILMRVYFLDSDGYMQLMETLQNLATLPYYQARQPLANACGAKTSNGLLTSILMPSLVRNFTTLAHLQADENNAQVALAATRYRLDHGTLPSRLADLVPTYLDSLPADPFDGQPLRLIANTARWTVYSLGPDQIDDGGIMMKNGKGDIPFSLSPPPKNN